MTTDRPDRRGGGPSAPVRFRPPPLGVTLWAGRADPDDTRLWVHVPDGAGCPVQVQVHGPDGTVRWRGSQVLEGDTGVVVVPPGTLEADSEWAATLDTPHGEATARFRTTSPATAAPVDDFAVAVLSCHQPFAPDGGFRPGALALLRPLPDALAAAGTAFALLVGDQVYADLPPGTSLFDAAHFADVGPPGRDHILDCDRDQVHALYADRCRAWFGVPELARLCARVATLPTIDDHEIVDNFGSDPAHADERWAALRAGALDAAWDFQLCRAHPAPSRPPSLHYTVAHGPFAAFVMDLRSQRRHDGERQHVVGVAQLADLRGFLAAQAARPFVAVVSSVPLVLAPEWAVAAATAVVPEGSDAHDRWSAPDARAERDRLLELLADHAARHVHQQVLLLSGDVHTGCVCTVLVDDAPSGASGDRGEGGRPLIQVVSSPISNLEDRARRVAAAALAPWTPLTGSAGGRTWRVELLPGEDGRATNPQPELNAGLLRFARDGDAWRLTIELLSAVDDRAIATFRYAVPVPDRG